MEKYCRFCAERKDNLSEISKIDRKVYGWLLSIVNLDDDGLSHNICSSCLCKVHELGLFIEKCKQSYENLKNLNANYIHVKNEAAECDENNVLQLSVESECESDCDPAYEEESSFTHIDVEILKQHPFDDKNTDKYKSKEISCKYCHQTFDSKTERNKHVKEHSFFCVECGQNFNNKRQYDYHMVNHQNKRNFCCTVCQMRFNHKEILRKHMAVHNDKRKKRIKKYSCQYCERKCENPSQLNVHLRFHQNDRPFKCNLCDQAYHLKSTLKTHIKKHADIKDRVCTFPGCGKAYRDSAGFKRHMDTHLPDEQKNYECDICQKRFSLHYIMTDHRANIHKKAPPLKSTRKKSIPIPNS